VSFALSLATLGNVQRAIELTREALATDPLRAAWYNRLARYSTALNRLDEAERALHQAMELQPTVTSHYELLTVIEIQRGDAQAGLAAAQRAAPGARQDVALASARQIGPDRGAADAALKTLALLDGVSTLEVTKIVGTSLPMIEKHYGHLVADTARARLAKVQLV
jgi:tetratricopeptide (TPR) repeat protein